MSSMARWLDEIFATRLEGSRFIALLGLWVGSRRLPGTFQRVVALSGRIRKVQGLKPWAMATCWFIPGSRLLSHFQVAPAVGGIEGGCVKRAKAAPLQALITDYSTKKVAAHALRTNHHWPYPQESLVIPPSDIPSNRDLPIGRTK